MTSYAEAGVDIAAGERAVELMKSRVARSRRPEVIDDPSGFAGLFDASAFLRYRKPLLATSTDGVGTKVMIAQRLDKHDTIGIDLVGMVVDDLVVCGAEPLFMTDYIACGKVVPERIAEIVGGIAEGCRIAGCALIGGETAEHPGAMKPDEYDLAGAGTGVVEASELLGPHRVVPGDVVLGMASSGIHSNGYSLVRHIIATAGLRLDQELPELSRTLGEELLEPTRIYAPHCLALTREVDVHAFAHITGGGLAANLARSLPATADALLDRGSWTPPAIFQVLAGYGKVPQAEMDRTFNLGVGMCAIVPADQADRAVELLNGQGVPTWVLGEVVPGSGEARFR
ncbi:phosphoribosylformylglycinamidine cyclo-ligase [Thermobispora bispora]|jgi:phosphoribosylformylglycinamidine cyclo-ligase|uniref:Phosphoribosylformylglycinamidine cyclo-ligase n=1 Tax=Thermobispora bispora (strain ATCC 19993 / DSM 43833 / CBS 139.67 / JCM 10125 / KCTC 9307 / NBRC 14880 / R51) TaxID=469371 RepID=D6Y9K3_THEBD|nr:phosphoribosylformylglycinamidine cyclo-ligase [Thermobispora bispora]MBO2473087.1 phosphoribosylformylglycinamidine cyclo-ligase [Actinomycetales bacterium]MDI9579474.1 phosphoribosylformylglycinamidine cyclo-ligase [Thermobispora sp.]ADG90034.1 phosphoribosylformylglycinamidine cyclo-ligase [Thermobispora bispora DSM 43833]MBX6168723.1 phosphoribosylformylglycinamidine cyclo-ligase [Thermobispora bispora]QSI46489.1 phosphoribosylformylglycinamidine cyclo-ligase [Thermobispora bispora]